MAGIPSYWANFGTFQFNSITGLQIYAVDAYNQATRNIDIYDLARRSARKVSSALYGQRQINISLWITSNNGRAGLDSTLDQLYANIQGTEQFLAIPQSGTTRQYIATYASQTINQIAGGFMDLTLTFNCSDSFGYDSSYTTIASQTFTTGTQTFAYTQGGSAATQTPFLQFQILNLTTTGGNQTITVSNTTTNQIVTISAIFNKYDLIQIDCQNEVVMINNVEVNYMGAIPKFALGSQSVKWTDTFTTRSIAALLYVYNRWN